MIVILKWMEMLYYVPYVYIKPNINYKINHSCFTLNEEDPDLVTPTTTCLILK
jgi:hypothetical protein